MEIFGYILFLACGIGGGFWLWGRKNGDEGQLRQEYQALLEEQARLRAELEVKLEKLGEMSELLKRETSEKDQFLERGKQLRERNNLLESDIKILRDKLAEREKVLSQFEADKERREREFLEKVEKLEHSREKLEKEQHRVIREDEVKQAQILEEQTRVWNDHENAALAELRRVCQDARIGFQWFENNDLPPDFDGTLKPDFLVDFLGQYIVFDAKKSKDIKRYIPEQVKETARKCRGNDKIYSTIFFVVPRDDISELKKLSFVEEGFSFFVISVESVEPILANFKRITEYDKIQEFDPQDRENIVNLIANYDRHISFQNAANILLTKESIGLMESKDHLPEDFQNAVEIRKQNMRSVKLKESDIKKISQNLHEQRREVSKLTTSKAPLESEMLRDAQDSLGV